MAISNFCKLAAAAILDKMAAAAILDFFRTGNSAIRSAVSENAALEPNIEWIGRPVAEIWPFEIFPRWQRPPSRIFSNRKYRH